MPPIKFDNSKTIQPIFLIPSPQDFSDNSDNITYNFENYLIKKFREKLISKKINGHPQK